MDQSWWFDCSGGSLFKKNTIRLQLSGVFVSVFGDDCKDQAFDGIITLYDGGPGLSLQPPIIGIRIFL